MKIILSRKGLDSANGGIPSPILPDGTLLSLPIPNDVNSYKFYQYKGKNLSEIIRELGGKSIDKCHYDPDIREDISVHGCGVNAWHSSNWKPALGQVSASLSHLRNQGVEEGDLFLFFGLFRKAEIVNGKYHFVKGAKAKHIIWGYLQIDGILHNPTSEQYPGLAAGHCDLKHPHLDRITDNLNDIFVACEKLSWDKNKKGAGVLQYKDTLVLTKEGMTASRWNLPGFMKDIEISYHPAQSWKDGYFQSAGRGQEFVFSGDKRPEILKWISGLIGADYHP